MFCGETSIRASTHYGETIATIKCRSWGCPECAETRQRQLQSQCINGKPNRFLTITCRAGQFGSKEANAAAIAKAWRTVVQRWRRQEKWHKCQYICVFEPHISGWPHLHILYRGHWMRQQWLSDQMNALLNSPRVHISAIHNSKQAAFYVAKYFSKGPQKFGNSKRYWTSQDYAKPYNTDAAPAFPKGIPVCMVPKPASELLQSWYHESRQVWTIRNKIFMWGELVDEQTGEIFARPPDAVLYEFGSAWDG